MNCTTIAPATMLVVLLVLPLTAQERYEAASRGVPSCFAKVDPQHGHRQSHQMLAIEDPATHQRWLLERAPKGSGAPAKLVPLPAESPCAFLKNEQSAAGYQITPPDGDVQAIHAGDTVVLFEHTSVLDAQLEAIALSRAEAGETMIVRLKTGGRLLHAIAVGPGRASLLAGAWEAHP